MHSNQAIRVTGYIPAVAEYVSDGRSHRPLRMFFLSKEPREFCDLRHCFRGGGSIIFVLTNNSQNGLPYKFIGFFRRNEVPFINNMVCLSKITLKFSALFAFIIAALCLAHAELNNNIMKRLILIAFAISLLHNYTDAQWYIQQSPVGSHLLDVEFINLNTGWACGDGGVILKTTNGGNNWLQQVSGVTNKNLFGIHPVDSEYVYCVGWFQTILKSTNGGSNWQILRNGTYGNDPSLFEVFFLDRNKGWMLRNNYILRTTNGGASFDSTNVVFSYLRDIYFKDILNGVLCGDG